MLDLRTLSMAQSETSSLTALYQAVGLRAHFNIPLRTIRIKQCDIHVPEFHQQFIPLLRSGIYWDQEEFGLYTHLHRFDGLGDEVDGDEWESENEDGDGNAVDGEDVNMDN